MEVKARMFLGHDFEPGGKVEFHRKDLTVALDAGRGYGVPPLITAMVVSLPHQVAL
jgi:2-hydroxy-3-oxopropionate reductase